MKNEKGGKAQKGVTGSELRPREVLLSLGSEDDLALLAFLPVRDPT